MRSLAIISLNSLEIEIIARDRWMPIPCIVKRQLIIVNGLK